MDSRPICAGVSSSSVHYVDVPNKRKMLQKTEGNLEGFYESIFEELENVVSMGLKSSEQRSCVSTVDAPCSNLLFKSTHQIPPKYLNLEKENIAKDKSNIDSLPDTEISSLHAITDPTENAIQSYPFGSAPTQKTLPKSLLVPKLRSGSNQDDVTSAIEFNQNSKVPLPVSVPPPQVLPLKSKRKTIKKSSTMVNDTKVKSSPPFKDESREQEVCISVEESAGDDLDTESRASADNERDIAPRVFLRNKTEIHILKPKEHHSTSSKAPQEIHILKAKENHSTIEDPPDSHSYYEVIRLKTKSHLKQPKAGRHSCPIQGCEYSQDKKKDVAIHIYTHRMKPYRCIYAEEGCVFASSVASEIYNHERAKVHTDKLGNTFVTDDEYNKVKKLLLIYIYIYVLIKFLALI
jgi:hypothetical protein